MAKTTPKTVKQLGQFLQEQQEPFVLESYLSERGHQKKKLNSERSISCSQRNPSKSLRRPGNSSPNYSRKGIPHFSKVLRAVYNKLISIKDSLRIKSNENRNSKFSLTEKTRNSQEAAESDRFSSASSTTVFNSCSESDVEESSASRQKDGISFKADTSQTLKLWSAGDTKATADRKLQWRCMEDSKQISPVSVLEEVSSDRDKGTRHDCCNTRGGSRSCITLTKKVTEDSLLSASFWTLFFQSAKEKPSCAGTELQELVQSKCSSQFLKSKTIVQQTKQLLFDCVREVIESNGKESKQPSPQECLGPELIGKLICEKLKAWGKQPVGDGFNITRLLDSDFQESVQEWNDFEPQMKDIAMEIGDSILEDIEDQIVTDMIYHSKI